MSESLLKSVNGNWVTLNIPDSSPNLPSLEIEYILKFLIGSLEVPQKRIIKIYSQMSELSRNISLIHKKNYRKLQ